MAEREWQENLDYAYAVGKIRVLENRLLNSSLIEELTEARDLETALKILGETDYAESMVGLRDFTDFEALLVKELKKVFNLIAFLSLDPELTHLLLLRYDLHNLKVLLKAKGRGVEAEGILYPLGTVKIGRLKEMVASGDFRDFPPQIQEVIRKALGDYASSSDPQRLAIIMEKGFYSYIHEVSGKQENCFLEELAQIWIDLANIKAFFRIKVLNRGRDLLSLALINGGKIETKLFLEFLDKPLGEFLTRLAYSPYFKVLDGGVKAWEKERSFRELERLADTYVIEYLKEVKYVVFGIEPLIGYALAKEQEIRTLRNILVGKANNLPFQVIRERMRKLYV